MLFLLQSNALQTVHLRTTRHSTISAVSTTA